MDEFRNRSFLRHAAVYGMGTLVLQAASVVLPLCTRYLTPADYGVLEILSRTGQVIAIFLMANGIGPASLSMIGRLVAERFGPEVRYQCEYVDRIPQEPSGKYRFCISKVERPFPYGLNSPARDG